MTKESFDVRKLRLCRIGAITAMVVVWGVLFLGVAVPSWRDVSNNHREITALETELADLDCWTVAGLWLGPAVEARRPLVMAEWERVFPSTRNREDLFLDVARVADRAGVREFQMMEINDMNSMDQGTWCTSGGAAEAPSATDAPPSDDATPTGSHQSSAVVLNLTPYVVRASFVSSYAAATAFLGGLEELERGLDVRQLSMRPAREGVTVELEMEVPVSEPLAS